MKILIAKGASGRGTSYPVSPPLQEPEDDIIYPDSDGKPMADNTKQFEWIVNIKENLEVMFQDDPNVFVAGDLLWYPVKGNNKLRMAPDAMVAFGRPKGYRGSYKTWMEDGIAPQVVFEIMSPGNRAGEMKKKKEFYLTYGVEEYYVYDPDRITLKGWIRDGNEFHPIKPMQGWISPRLKIRFELTKDDLIIFKPDGEPFLSRIELERLRKEAENKVKASEIKLKKVEQKAKAERQRAKAERQRAEAAERLAEQLAAKLRQLGIEALP